VKSLKFSSFIIKDYCIYRVLYI